MVYLVGITGGSGSGKSTLAYGLQVKFPDLIEVVHFDDYQKAEEDVPIHQGMKNWDHPDAINFSNLLKDLKLLKNGKSVQIMTKSTKHNPQYEENGRIPYVMEAKKIILVEGYMALTNDDIRKLYDFTIFLDLSSKERIKRRTKFINPEYKNKVLLPMHEQHVESTKNFADIVINVEKYNEQEVQELVLRKLKSLKIISGIN